MKRNVWLKCIDGFTIYDTSYVSGQYYPGFLLESGMIQLPPPIPSTYFYTPGLSFILECPYEENLKKILE